jgi:hypothetical protein
MFAERMLKKFDLSNKKYCSGHQQAKMMDPYTMAAYLQNAQAVSPSLGPVRRSRRGHRVWSSTVPRLPSNPYMFKPQKPQCQAETLRATSDLVTGIPGEQWVQCNGRATAGDILCSAHRRQTNLSAISMGKRASGSSAVRVPIQAYIHRDCKFPIAFATNIAAAMRPGEKVIEPPDGKMEIWNPLNFDAYMNAIGKIAMA